MIFVLTIGIYYLIIRPGYLTDNRGAKNRIDFDIVVYPFTTLVIPKTDWWQRTERNIPVVVTNGDIGVDATPVVTTIARN